MTETQAKSGAAGASTDAGDPRVETPATTEQDAAESESSGSTEFRESPTNVIRTPAGGAPSTPPRGSTSDGPSNKTTSPASSGSAAATNSSPPTLTPPAAPAPVNSSAASYTPVAVPSTPPSPVTNLEDVRAVEPTVKTPAPAAVPVVSGAPSVQTGGAKGSAVDQRGKSRGADQRGKGTATAKPPAAGPATGTAPVVKPGKATGPVIARATVGGTTTVTGTGIRQTTGSTSVITPPTRSGAAAAAAVGAARVSEAVRSARATVTGAASRGPRRARLHLKRIDPWSVMKFSFAVSLVLFVVAIVATSVLYLALDAMNVFESINKAFAEVTGQAGGAADAFKITAKGVIGTAVLLGAVNMVLFTALMTLGAFVYNVCADLVGGVELTLSEKE
jgi:hypothetical protein